MLLSIPWFSRSYCRLRWLPRQRLSAPTSPTSSRWGNVLCCANANPPRRHHRRPKSTYQTLKDTWTVRLMHWTWWKSHWPTGQRRPWPPRIVLVSKRITWPQSTPPQPPRLQLQLQLVLGLGLGLGLMLGLGRGGHRHRQRQRWTSVVMLSIRRSVTVLCSANPEAGVTMKLCITLPLDTVVVSAT